MTFENAESIAFGHNEVDGIKVVIGKINTYCMDGKA